MPGPAVEKDALALVARVFAGLGVEAAERVVRSSYRAWQQVHHGVAYDDWHGHDRPQPLISQLLLRDLAWHTALQWRRSAESFRLADAPVCGLAVPLDAALPHELPVCVRERRSYPAYSVW